MMDRDEIAVTLPARVLDRLRREASAGGVPLRRLVAALAEEPAA